MNKVHTQSRLVGASNTRRRATLAAGYFTVTLPPRISDQLYDREVDEAGHLFAQALKNACAAQKVAPERSTDLLTSASGTSIIITWHRPEDHALNEGALFANIREEVQKSELGDLSGFPNSRVEFVSNASPSNPQTFFI